MPSTYVVYSSFTSLKTTSNFIYLKSIYTFIQKKTEKSNLMTLLTYNLPVYLCVQLISSYRQHF